MNTGTRTIKGIAAVNGLALRRMRVGRDIKDQISGFEAAAAEMEATMKAVRELDIKPHNEMESGKLPDTFSAFKKRVGPKKGEESETTLEEEESEEEEPKEKDDEVDFDVSDEDAEFEEEDQEDQPEEPPEPVWPDIMNGPLTGGGTLDVEPCTGQTRFPHAPVWPVRRPEKGILPDELFTTVTRVVTASPGGLPKVVISYALEALPKDKRMDPEPWKAEELRNLMRLSRLRVGVQARQLVTFGFSSVKDDIPEAPEENSYFPQYVPTRTKCSTPSFTVTYNFLCGPRMSRNTRCMHNVVFPKWARKSYKGLHWLSPEPYGSCMHFAFLHL